MKRPPMLFEALLQQAAMDLNLPVERDVVVIRRRFEHEGLSFLTITLPMLSDSLEQGLEHGFFTCPTSFCRHGRLPRFLGGFFKNVFRVDGCLLDKPCVESIHWIRQICRFYKKPRIGCTPRREAKAIARYKQVEGELRHATNDVERVDPILDQVSNILWGRVFMDLDPQSLVCRHGPGATAEKYLSNERREIRQWYSRSEESYPVCDHAFHNYWEAAGYGYSSGVSGIEMVDLPNEKAVRVVFVPKTLTSPRVIAIEPSNVQFMQQATARYMMEALEQHSLTKHSVRFLDQSVNQSRARLASVSRKEATLDLSDASDRVHLHLVNRIFAKSNILEYLQDARSLHADLPDGSNLVLWKYASMGSALCFPVEACVFYTLILSSIFTSIGETPTASAIRRLSKRICVYGDDLIVPVEYAGVVTSYLESYALRVNRHKSFAKSLFRESCGGDYFNGVDVKPIYARELIPESRSGWDQTTLESWVSTANQFYMAGKWQFAQFLRDLIQSDLRTSVPRSRRFGAGLHFSSLIFDTNCGYNRSLCCYQQKRIVYTPLKRKDIIDGTGNSCFNAFFEARAAGILQRRKNVESHCEILRSHVRDRSGLDEQREQSQSTTVAVEGHRPTDSIDESTYGSLSGSCSAASRDEGTYSKLDDWTRRETVHRQLGWLESGTLDFNQSTKRGVFKLKRRWVTLVG